MLYVTTRNNRDAFTVNRAIQENRASDGGHYLPFRHPRFSPEEMNVMLQKSFGQCTADILNLLFHTKLTGWDVDFCVGRHPIHLESLRHRIFLAECWHTPGYRFDRIVRALTARLGGDGSHPSGWMEIAIRAAVLFGIFADLRREGIIEADISCISGDFIMPISAWYAKRWGLPVGNIIICCNENNAVWDLFCHGQMRTDAVSIPTILPAADVAVPDHLERLIYECGGILETQHYLDVCRKGRTYCPADGILTKLRGGIYVSVVSSQRIQSTIPGALRTHGHLMSPCTALSYAGLLDHRAKTGSTGYAIVWSEESPADEAQVVAHSTGIPEALISEWI